MGCSRSITSAYLHNSLDYLINSLLNEYRGHTTVSEDFEDNYTNVYKITSHIHPFWWNMY